MIKRVTFLLLVFAANLPFVSMDSMASGYQFAAPARTLVRNSGWNVRPLRRLKMKSQSLLNLSDGRLKKVNQTVLAVPKEGILIEDTASCARDSEVAHSSPMNAYTVVKYDVGGRVFCYTVFGPGVSILKISKTEKRVGALGCLSAFAYYDKDGDGRFETLVALATDAPFSPLVPGWVLQGRK